MKNGKIFLFFFITLPISIFIRTTQLFNTIDIPTGFFKNEYAVSGNYILLIIMAIAAILAFVGFISHKDPACVPKTGFLLSLASLFLSGTIIAELVDNSFYTSNANLQTFLLLIMSVITAVYFFSFGISGFFGKALPASLTVIPSIYLIIKIVCIFSLISSHSLLSDDIMFLAAYSVCLLFFISFGRLYNKIGSETNFRKLLSWGLTAPFLCFTEAIPHYIFNFANKNAYQHTTSISNLALLAFGVFILCFTISYFSAGKEKSKHTHR